MENRSIDFEMLQSDDAGWLLRLCEYGGGCSIDSGGDSGYKNLLACTAAYFEGALLLTASRRGSWRGH